MATLIKLDDAHKRYGPQVLLDGTSIDITDDHKVGLIGRNGSGKSTLIRVLLGEEELDKGQVIYHPRLRLGYLRQHDPFQDGESVIDFLVRDTGQEEWRCGEVAGRFEIKNPRLESPVQTLSGGWQTRVKLTALLLHEPNLLLLDEPTNFLDLRTQMLLEDFLRSFEGGCVIVSHDRTFLNDTCSQTLSLSRGKLTLYNGNVDSFLAFEKQQREHDERSNAITLAKRQQLETFIAKNRGHPDTATQAKAKAKQLERLEMKVIEGAEKTVRMKVPRVQARSGPALRCMDLNIGYPERVVATGIGVEVDHGKRIAVVGDNGQGKTTFLRTVTGSLDPLQGEIRWSFGCDIGCYAQHVYGSMPEHYTVREYLTTASAPDCTVQTVLDMAGSFLFRGDDVDKPISILSGGERARLCLAGLLLGRYTVLVLDEPANHLDVETVEALAEALNRYEGTVIFTSHDRTFLEEMANGVIEVRDGSVTNYLGSYSDYLYRVRKEIDEGARSVKPAKADDGPETKQSKAERKARNRRLFELRSQLKSVERQMTKYTGIKAALEDELDTITDPQELETKKQEHIAVAEKLEGIEHRWLKLQEKAEKEGVV